MPKKLYKISNKKSKKVLVGGIIPPEERERLSDEEREEMAEIIRREGPDVFVQYLDRNERNLHPDDTIYLRGIRDHVRQNNYYESLDFSSDEEEGERQVVLRSADEEGQVINVGGSKSQKHLKYKKRKVYSRKNLISKNRKKLF